MTPRNAGDGMANRLASPERRRGMAVAAATAASPLLGGWPLSASTQAASSPTPRHGTHGRRRKLGALDVSALGFGGLDASTGCYSPPKGRAEMVRLRRSAYDQGVDFFDTAEVYGPIVSQDVVGQALAPMRDKVTIATRFGFSLTPDSQAHGRTDSHIVVTHWPRHIDLAGVCAPVHRPCQRRSHRRPAPALPCALNTLRKPALQFSGGH